MNVLSCDTKLLKDGIDFKQILLDEVGPLLKNELYNVKFGDLFKAESASVDPETVKHPENSRRVNSFGDVPIGAHLARYNCEREDNFDHCWVFDIDESDRRLFCYYECVPVSGTRKATVVYREQDITCEYINEFFAMPTFVIKTKKKVSFDKSVEVASNELQLCYRNWNGSQSRQFVVDVLSGQQLPVPSYATKVYSFDELANGTHVARFLEKPTIHDRFCHFWVQECDQYEEKKISYFECEPLDKFSNWAVVSFKSEDLTEEFTAEFFRVPVYKIDNPKYKATYYESEGLAKRLHNERKTFRVDGVFRVWDSFSSEDLPFFLKTGKIQVKSCGFSRLLSSPLESLSKCDRIDAERDVGLRYDSGEEEALKVCKVAASNSLKELQRAEVLALIAENLGWNLNIPKGLKKLIVINTDDAIATTKSSLGKMTARAAGKNVVGAAVIGGARFVGESLYRKRTLRNMAEDGDITDDQLEFYLKKAITMSAASEKTKNLLSKFRLKT